MVTLKDVAQAAGVSIATVSCCLNGTRNVSPNTKGKIMEAVEKLKYIPNSAARNLKKSHSSEIGILLTSMEDGYHTEILKGITDYLQSMDVDVNIAFSDGHSASERKYLDNFIGKNLSGLILITCQPQNSEYLKGRIEKYNIPVVFVDRRPENLDCNFVGFDNRKTISAITHSLIKKGYSSICLFTGPLRFSSQKDCVDGYHEAVSASEIPFNGNPLYQTNMSREDAFKTAISVFHPTPPQAVIASSSTIAEGVLEACNVLGIRVPYNMTMVTLGEEGWNTTQNLPGVVHTSRSAFSLGTAAAKLLEKNIGSPYLFEKQSLLLEDAIVGQDIALPPVPRSFSSINMLIPKRRLRLLAMDLGTIRALDALSKNFTSETGIEVDIDLTTQDLLLEQITGGQKDYDIYMYDAPWMDFLAQGGYIMDISDFVNNDIEKDKILPENLSSCVYNGRYYGIPIVGGAQIMFYRKDIFEDLAIQKEFQSNYKISLRPPLTWTEFNGIAKFFTRKYTPHSPVEFGTSFAGINNQELAPELLMRLWASGGQLFSTNDRPTLNTPEVAKAFRSTLDTTDHTEKSPFETSIETTVEDFYRGRTAMCITYTQHASQIANSMHSKIIGKIGFSTVPGRTPVSIGWNFGISPFTKMHTNVYQFFSWLYRRSTSYYMTILDGQSVSTYPYANNELRKLYPWMSQTIETFKYTQRRTGPKKANSLVIPQSGIEEILCDAFGEVYSGRSTIPDALAVGQEQLEMLFKAYGY